jgi:unsaturated rhamnogalacturonyl hydrolase
MGRWKIGKPETRRPGVVVKILSRLAFTFALTAAATGFAPEQQLSVSHRAALAALERWPAGAPASAQGDEPDLLLAGLDAVWQNTVDRSLIVSIESAVDLQMGETGPHGAPSASMPQSGVASEGSLLLRLYGVTQDRRYFAAATQIYDQLIDSSEPPAGQLPFLAEYAATFHHAEAFAGLTTQLTKTRGQGSTHTLAWNLWALADSLPFYAADDPARAPLLALLTHQAQTAASTQDPSSGLGLKDASHAAAPDRIASGLIVFAIAKAVRLGYLPERDLAPAERAYKMLISRANSLGNPQQTGAFLLAASEMENAQNARVGRGKTVVVDGWFNSQMHADPTGRQIYFHYKWDDQSNNGFSLLGRILRNYGAETGTLYVAPTTENLRGAQVYIVVSPDIPSKNPHPHYIQAEDGAQIADWVRAGGVLVLLANDPANTDLDGMNRIADHFGMHFNNVLLKHVIGDQYGMGKIAVAGGGAIFHQPHALFMKDVCSIRVMAPAVSVLSENGDTWMAVARYGKGTVYANVDPWLYNEYADGRKLPAEYDNYAGGAELVRWLLQQIPRNSASAAAHATRSDGHAAARR